MQDTAVGVATVQSANAVINNVDLLDAESKQTKLLAKLQASVASTTGTTDNADSQEGGPTPI